MNEHVGKIFGIAEAKLKVFELISSDAIQIQIDGGGQ